AVPRPANRDSASLTPSACHPIGPLYSQLDLEPETGCGRYLLNPSGLSCLMPANLSPEYKAAEAALRKSRGPQERPDCLRE
ncbi:MAG: hypothetical protein ACREUO_04615, partial [Burkholderiales bacterium]